MVRYTLEQHVFLHDTYVKYESARRCWRKSRRKFHDERVPSRRTIYNLMNKLRSTVLLIDKKQKHARWVLTEEILGDTGSRLEHTARKSLKRLAQETGVPKSSTRRVSQLMKLRPSNTTVIHALQPRHPARRVHFCSWFLQSVVEGAIYSQLTLFSDEAWFHLQGYINTHNNRYWNSQNPHLTDEAPLRTVKVDVL
jgi:hypothetical protein